MASIVMNNGNEFDHEPITPNGVVLVMKLANRKGTLVQSRVIGESIKQITEDFVLERERSGVCITANKPEDVEKLLALKELNDGTPVSITMHPHRNVIRRVVNVDGCCNMTDEEIQQELAPQGITGVRRIKRKNLKGQKENTEILVLTYSPTVKTYKTVWFGYILLKTFPYYTDLQQCFKCWEFRHIKPYCPQETPICGICSGPHDTVTKKACCKVEFCEKCSSFDHPISSRKCPEYQRERRIHQIRIEKSVSYFEAKFEYERSEVMERNEFIKYLNTKVAVSEADLKKKEHEVMVLRGLFQTMKAAKEAEQRQQQQPNSVQMQKKKVSTKADEQSKKEPPKEEAAEKCTEEKQENDKSDEHKARRKRRGKKGRGK